MDQGYKIDQAISLSKISPVLVVGVEQKMFDDVTVVEGTIPSTKLGILNTSKGLKTPSWFYDIVKNKSSHQILITDVDAIDKENQEKFYELLKYKSISNVPLPKDCSIIVTAKNLKNVSEAILRLCQIIQ